MTKLYTKDEIVLKAQEIAKMISETEEVEFFKQAEVQVNENLKIQQLISKIKRTQKEAVNLEHYGKSEAQKQADIKIEALQDELDEIPLVKEFKQSQMDVNNLLQLVATTITNTVTDEIIKSTGGDVLRGTTTPKNKRGKLDLM
ncbi:RicAFT regulatory complex protein RicA family protein [Anaerobacillus isosaccharinicus]|uniref:RicAFT regulatory complex protein RicA family protein n=1 Tax=Anaerobacillus isosaccharinicus TaxID=1532552 RepID=A0A1S2M999_9BACI|nr:RicAFT regulatory complex protein RicA family protein [Anaerobacillus isosaccharinicus]MBA5587255.1 RicAFT regulatory complex protein RicA family protein [Anaerobacillus isosaccharinicus]QOY34551.1 RicAFT regulatory complex protein RicA family protein [Anaerobacillus isosaccharinicus]